MCDVRVYDFLCVILAKNQLETLGLVWLVLATESKFIIGNFKKKSLKVVHERNIKYLTPESLGAAMPVLGNASP